MHQCQCDIWCVSVVSLTQSYVELRGEHIADFPSGFFLYFCLFEVLVNKVFQQWFVIKVSCDCRRQTGQHVCGGQQKTTKEGRVGLNLALGAAAAVTAVLKSTGHAWRNTPTPDISAWFDFSSRQKMKDNTSESRSQDVSYLAVNCVGVSSQGR